MRVDIITLFPEMVAEVFKHSILKRASEKNLIDIVVTNPRDFTYDKHHIVDDTPFGGGTGMVMKIDPIFRTVQSIKDENFCNNTRTILLCPRGNKFDQEKAKELAQYEQIILICGHYEGIDERVQNIIDESISIGDYVLTGGEIPAMAITDAVARMIPGVLGSDNSAKEDSFFEGCLKYPQYTRPREFNGWEVPEILISGDHAKIDRWRRKEALKVTLKIRPDLLQNLDLSKEDKEILQEILAEEGEDNK